jgi:hypothetical protein
MKKDLYDVLLTLPPPDSGNVAQRIWPKLESAEGAEMKATQRDLRRYKALRWRITHPISPPPSPPTSRRASSSAQSLETPRAKPSPYDEAICDIPDTDSIVEPLSWPALAYSGFMWWASAGEQRLHSEEEVEADNALFSGLSISPSRSYAPLTALKTESVASQEMGIIAYFHRLTTQILTTLSDIVDATDSDDEREDDDLLLSEESGPAVYVSSADMARMGLDIWSSTDHVFVKDIAMEYFGRRAEVEGGSFDVCGIRIC